MNLIEKGYAKLLNVPVESFHQELTQIIETSLRDQPSWAKWVMPVWIIRFTAAPVCSVSPYYGAVAEKLVEKLNSQSVLTASLLSYAQTLLNTDGTWQQREILIYNKSVSIHEKSEHNVEKLTPKSHKAARLLNLFDGGVFVIRNNFGDIVCYAGIKNKGLIQEIAVHTNEAYRRQGMARAVISAATNNILAGPSIPTYIPDRLDNTASYLLAEALGFEKVGEMFFFECELSNWKGFYQEKAFSKYQRWVREKIFRIFKKYRDSNG
jgi:RimJ/RimL family protein N-acetyltransferase